MTEYDKILNYKILQNVMNINKVDKNLDVDKLINGIIYSNKYFIINFFNYYYYYYYFLCKR